jgi:hypothetical protein
MHGSTTIMKLKQAGCHRATHIGGPKKSWVGAQAPTQISQILYNFEDFI